jgi:hypothetical protein
LTPKNRTVRTLFFTPVRGKPLNSSAGTRHVCGRVLNLNEILCFSINSEKNVFINHVLNTRFFNKCLRKKKSAISSPRTKFDQFMAYAYKAKSTFLHSISVRATKSQFCAIVFWARKYVTNFLISVRKIFVLPIAPILKLFQKIYCPLDRSRKTLRESRRNPQNGHFLQHEKTQIFFKLSTYRHFHARKL